MRLLLILLVLYLPISARAAPAGDWPTYLGNNARTGYNPSETVITPSTAPHLQLRWQVSLAGTPSIISSQPIVANDSVYWTGWDGIVHASTLAGAPVWTANLGQTSVEHCNPSVLGIADSPTLATVSMHGVDRSVLFVGGGLPDLYALDASTGAVLWRTPLGEPKWSYIWASPAVYDGSVYVGLASIADCPVTQGKIFQVDAATGAVRHVFKAVPDGCAGAGIWGSPAINEADGTLYIATGNSFPCGQDEPYAQAVVELRAEDLSVLGAWTIPPNQTVNDSDFGSTPTLFESMGTPMVGVANKNGIFYAFRQDDLAAGPVWEQQIAAGGDCPDCGLGSISPAAFDGSLLYVAGGRTRIANKYCGGSVRALDPATGNVLWERCVGPVLGAVTAVPGLVEVGAGNHLVVLDAVTGNVLFRYADGKRIRFYGAGTIAEGVLLQGDVGGTLFAFAP